MPYTKTMPELSKRMQQIEAKLARLAGRADFKPPGPPLTDREVIVCERRHGVELPSEYREFLLAFGTGGNGPAGGIVPLDRVLAATMDDDPADLAAPSVLDPTKGFHDYGDVQPARGTATLTADPQDWFFTLLVVSGGHRGRLLHFVSMFLECDWVESATGGFPGFADWYEAYLDKVLAGASPETAVGQMLGDERSLTELALDTTAPDRLRGKAVGALSGLPALRDRAATIEVFRTAFDGGSPALQRNALSAWLRVAPEDEGAAKALRRAIASPDPQLRGRAASEAGGLGRRFTDVLLAGLDDPDPRIVLECVMTLARWDALTLPLLSKLHGNPSSEVRLHVLGSLEKILDPRSVKLALASLSDPSPFVRRHAATSLEALGAREAAPALESAIEIEQDAMARKAMLSVLQALR
jgi:hypothetical protein